MESFFFKKVKVKYSFGCSYIVEEVSFLLHLIRNWNLLMEMSKILRIRSELRLCFLKTVSYDILYYFRCDATCVSCSGSCDSCKGPGAVNCTSCSTDKETVNYTLRIKGAYPWLLLRHRSFSFT